MNDIYNMREPTDYFLRLSSLDYQIPQEAKPRFQRLIEARRRATGSEAAKVVDIGCSYGINGALLKHHLSMDDLYRHYAAVEPSDSEARLVRDRNFYAEPADPALTMIGIDPADRALSYAIDMGILDAGISTDLETRDPTPEDAATIENADLIISTGCIGYVTETTLERLLKSSYRSNPWMAHFVLRMFDFSASEEMLRRHGYVTEKVDGLFRQRRFASANERRHVLDNLHRLGIDATGAEADGWYLAELHVARPEKNAKSVPLGEILGGSTDVI
ncbi:class I SAM-dependent methyltransferase [Aurantimonas sp. C2-3-R2]|nr:class I SAM-dependent methyltransferase [Aurantimonas sp. C2-3-R2]